MARLTNVQKWISSFHAIDEGDREKLTAIHRESFKETEKYLKDEIDISAVTGDGSRLAVLYGVLQHYLKYIERKVNESPSVVVVTEEDVEVTLESGQVRKVHKVVKREV